MAGPALGMAGMGMSAGGGVLSGVSSIIGGYSQSKQFKYQAAVAKANAEIERSNAEFAIRKGEGQALITGRKTAQLIGTQLAHQGASGLDVNFGSPTQVRESQHTVGMEDMTTIRENAGRVAYGHLVGAANEDAKAKALGAAASTSVTAGWISGIGSFLGTAGSVASKWYQGSQLGMFGGPGVSRDTMLGPATTYNQSDDMPTATGDW